MLPGVKRERQSIRAGGQGAEGAPRGGGDANFLTFFRDHCLNAAKRDTLSRMIGLKQGSRERSMLEFEALKGNLRGSGDRDEHTSKSRC